MNVRLRKDIDSLRPMIEQRGYIITRAITIESTIDRIILNHYISDDQGKAKEFHDEFLKNIPLGKKIERLKFIIAKHGIDLDNSKFKNLPNLLKDIIELRNKMAHWQWSYITEDKVTLWKKMSKEPEVIGEKEFDSFYSKCNQCSGLLSHLYFSFNNPEEDS